MNHPAATPAGRRTSLSRALGVFTLVGMATAGCQEINFESPDEITKLRILGVQLDPPEAGPGETVRASVVLAAPDPAAVAGATVSWEICAFQGSREEFYACPRLGDGTSLGLPLGEGPEIEIDVALLQAAGLTARALCENVANLELPEFIELPGCERGYDATLRWVVTGVDGEELVGIKSFPLLFEEEAVRDDDRNTNPRLAGLLFDGLPRASGTRITVSLAEHPSLALQALANVEDAEEYTFPDPERPGERRPPVREQLQLAWFASIGELRNARTFYADGIAPGAELQSNLWRLLRGVRAEPGQTAQLWLVLRDDRGGLDWGTWTFEFEP